jgi:Protein of unknown function (DUF4238)
MPEKKKQHYVPRFYLKSFSDNSGKTINLFNLERKQSIRGASLKNQCYEKYFYGEEPEIENSLGKIEGIAAKIIRDIISENDIPKRFSSQHNAILSFILLQYARTKYSEESEIEMTNKLVNSIIEKDPRFMNNKDNDIKISMKNAIINKLKSMAQSIPIAWDLHFMLLVNKTRTNFITSDNPVVFYNQACERAVGISNTGLASKGLQIFFPLSPKHLLIFFDSQVYQPIKNNNSDSYITSIQDVVQLNDLQWLNSLKNIYYDCNQKDLEILNEFEKNITRKNPEKVSFNEYLSEPNKKDKELKFLLHMSKPDLKIALKLEFFEQIKTLSDEELYNGAESSREPDLSMINDVFLTQVNKGLYKLSEFPRFLKELRENYESTNN